MSASKTQTVDIEIQPRADVDFKLLPFDGDPVRWGLDWTYAVVHTAEGQALRDSSNVTSSSRRYAFGEADLAHLRESILVSMAQSGRFREVGEVENISDPSRPGIFLRVALQEASIFNGKDGTFDCLLRSSGVLYDQRGRRLDHGELVAHSKNEGTIGGAKNETIRLFVLEIAGLINSAAYRGR